MSWPWFDVQDNVGKPGISTIHASTNIGTFDVFNTERKCLCGGQGQSKDEKFSSRHDFSLQGFFKSK